MSRYETIGYINVTSASGELVERIAVSSEDAEWEHQGIAMQATRTHTKLRDAIVDLKNIRDLGSRS